MYIPSDPKIWQEIGRDQLIRKPKFWLPLTLVLMIVNSPEDIFQSFPILTVITETTSSLIPSINTWVERSFIPSTTKLLFSYYWLVMPYYIVIYAKERSYEDKFVTTLLADSRVKRYLRLILLFVLQVIFFLVFYFFALPEDPNCRRQCIHESIGWQVMYGWGGAIGISYFTASNYWWVKNFRIIHFQFRNKEDIK